MPVVSLDIFSRRPYACGIAFKHVGPYECIEGTMRFTVAPDHPAHARIVDLHLAPRDAHGAVGCHAEFRVLRPVDPDRGNRRLLFDVVNRGNPTVLRNFNYATGPLDPGDGFLMRRGYTITACGWQGDLLSPAERNEHGFPPAPGLLRAHVPEALTEAGEPITGLIAVTFQPAERACVMPLAAGAQRPHPTIDPADPDAILYVRDHANAPERAVPRSQWSFSRLDGARMMPDAGHIHMSSGFEPGRIYTAVYTTRGAAVLGLGLVMPRDFVSFLRHADAQAGNPCAGQIDRALAFGRSQSGSFLRHVLYRGFTRDLADRPLFDGILSLVAGGGRTEINQRFGQPGAGPKHTFGRTWPFTDTVQTDPVTGDSDGLLATLGQRAPKVFFINTASEYWRGDAALIHTMPDGSGDVPSSDCVRIYHYAGAQHGPGQLPALCGGAWRTGADRPLDNVVDYRPFLRAALVRLDRWASGVQPPPPSCHPRLQDATAVPPPHVAKVFHRLPGVQFPEHLPGMHRMDFGPQSGRGILTRLPPAIGEAYAELVPAVDEDGNEVAGVRPLEVAVPLATHTGWRVRDACAGGLGQLHTLLGATWPFLATTADRKAARDPRRAIEQRYASRGDYLDAVARAAAGLMAAGHLLDEDLPTAIARAVALYDALAARDVRKEA
jgi:hypothetical protein